MGAAEPKARSFSQLDRRVFGAYFLGAVVPLVALGIAVDRLVLRLGEHAGSALAGLVASMALLSLLAFLSLRRSTLRALQEIQADKGALAVLVDSAGKLVGGESGIEVAMLSTSAALSIGGAEAAYIYRRAEVGPPERVAALGRDAEKLEDELAEPMAEIRKLALEENTAVLRGASADAPALAAVPLRTHAKPTGALLLVGKQGFEHFQTATADVLQTLANLASVSMGNADLRYAQRNFFVHVTEILVSALDQYVHDQVGHSAQVAEIANRIGRQLELDEDRLERLHFAALLHDLGMLRLPRDERSRESARDHPVVGARMVSRITLWRDLAPAVHHHHEWWNGSGYPEALAGEAIPLASRIIAVCDAYDAMTSHTSYQEARTPEDALRELVRCAGTQFDPAVVRALVETVPDAVVPTARVTRD